MLLVRCVQAVGLASFWSSATATVSEAAPPQARGRWLGLYRLTTSASLLLGPLVAFGLVKAAGFAACFWMLAGCSAVALTCVGAMRLPRRRRERLRVKSPCVEGSLSLSGVVGMAVTGTSSLENLAFSYIFSHSAKIFAISAPKVFFMLSESSLGIWSEKYLPQSFFLPAKNPAATS